MILQVEVVSHYGTEHYCPISLFRVYGNNEYEVLDSEESPTGEEFSTDEDALDSKSEKEEGPFCFVKLTNSKLNWNYPEISIIIATTTLLRKILMNYVE